LGIVHPQILLVYWVDHSWYFPSSHWLINFPLSFTLSWPLVFVIVFLPFLSEIFPWVYWTWNILAYPYPGSSLFLHWDSFAVHSVQWFSLRHWITLLHASLAFSRGLCWEVWGDSYVFTFVYELAFSLTAFNILSLFSSFGILIMIWCDFFSCQVYLEFKMPLVQGCLYHYIDLENFLLWFLN
jgi:hypothetical protein